MTVQPRPQVVLERVMHARDDVLPGALQVVTGAKDIVPDLPWGRRKSCPGRPREQWVDQGLTAVLLESVC